MLKTNKEKLIKVGVQGKVVNAGHGGSYGVSSDGKPVMVPGMGGIMYNVKVGDPAFGWVADHLEPCVSSILNEEKRHDGANSGYVFHACVGNEVLVLDLVKDFKEEFKEQGIEPKGIITGHHGGAEHVMIDFPDIVLDRINLDSKFLIRSFGQGLRLLDYPDVACYNLDPGFLEAMNIKENNNVLEIPVAASIPGELMGSGTGSLAMGKGDYDIMTTDKAYIKELKLDSLRLGDLVAIINHDNVYGRSYLRGAVSIGIIIHGDSHFAGHGPGVTTLIASRNGEIKPVASNQANIADILKIGRTAS